MSDADRHAPTARSAHPDAVRLARRAASQWGLQAPEVLSVGTNTVFAAGDAVVLRVSRADTPVMPPPEMSQRLAGAGIRVPMCIDSLSPLDDPATGLSVRALERLIPEGRTDWRETGRMIRRLHELGVDDVASGHRLRRTVDFAHWDFTARLAECRADPPIDLDGATVDALGAAIATIGDLTDLDGPEVICHGDLHPGNTVTTARGTYLLDWDLCATGHPAWDHAPLMTWTQRWGGEERLYEEFASGYGRSYRDSADGERLALGRLLAATLMRVVAARDDPAAAVEAARRLAWWRGDPDAPVWRSA